MLDPHILSLLAVLLLLLLAPASAAPCYTAFDRADFPHCVELGPNGSYSLAWRVGGGSGACG
jgi:hypothetical protein